MATVQDSSVSVLNSFLRGEISAVETYRQALDTVSAVPVRTQLQDCMMSHARRVDVLREQISSLGGEPAEGSGIWGTFAKAVEGGAKVLGEKAAVAALEEGEDHGRKEYRQELDKLDATTRAFVQSRIMPEQERTHSALSMLKRTLAS
jgi:uncharacterized protein (TIGR02284 family)